MEFVKKTEDYKDLLTQRLNQYYDVLEWRSNLVEINNKLFKELWNYKLHNE
jgi:hypothetical protein